MRLSKEQLKDRNECVEGKNKEGQAFFAADRQETKGRMFELRPMLQAGFSLSFFSI